MVSLRPATPSDADLLRRWDAEPHVIAAHCDAPDSYDPSDEQWDWDVELSRSLSWREMFVIAENERPVGCLQIIDPADEETHYWGDVPQGRRALDIWLGNPDDLGRGTGTAAMRLALDRCFAVPTVSAVLIDPLASNVRAIRFYERLGFHFVEHRTFGDSECAVYRFDRPARSDRRRA